jgi:hypothetical protein
MILVLLWRNIGSRVLLILVISSQKGFVYYLHEGDSITRSQMDIKRKTCDIRIWEKHLSIDMSSTNIDTLVPSLYQCVETRSIEVFWLLSQPLPHLRFNLFVTSETFATFLDPVGNSFTRQILPTVKTEHLFMNISFIESFCSQKKSVTELCSSVVHSSSTVAVLTTKTKL